MAEELRFFLRSAIYVGVAGVVYWFISYEVAGSVLLIVLALAILAFVAGVAFFARRSVSDLRPPESGAGRIVAVANRLVGFHESREHEAEPPLAAPPGLIPIGSAWPLVAGAGAAVAGMGLIYGPWLLLPGVALGVLALWGWLTQFDRL